MGMRGDVFAEQSRRRTGNLFRATALGVILVFTSAFSLAQDTATIQKLIDEGNAIYYSNPDSSYTLCCGAEDLAKKAGTPEYLGKTALCKARYYILVTDYQAAATELYIAIQFFTTKEDYPSLSRAYSLKSILLDRIGEPKASTDMLREAYLISKNHGDRAGEIARLSNLSLDFIEQNQPDSAYKYLLIMESLKADIKDEHAYFLEQNLGLYYHLVGDYTKAIYYFQRAKLISEKYDMVDSRATVHERMAGSYLALEMYAEAEQAALISYEISVDNKLVFEERDAIKQLVLVYEAEGNYQKAFDFRGRLIDVDDRINVLEKVQKLKEDEYKLNLSAKETELAEKEVEVQKEQLKSARAQSQNLVLIFVVLVIVLVLTFTLFIYLRTRKLNRTIEISRIILEQKNREVRDSINYAKQIQEAILPPVKYFKALFPEIFVMYRPKDIVAGDFYWFDRRGDKVFFAAADCTGHGVPGAMVSVICHSALNRSVNEFGLTVPAEILEKTSELVMGTFAKSDRAVKDGMDIALCALDLKTLRLDFSGANNPVWIIKSKQDPAGNHPSFKYRIETDTHALIELRGDKQPIGHFENKQSFTNQNIQLETGDTVYLSTDGYIDQFGGEKGKKLKSRFFKEKILQIQNHDIAQQYLMITSVFDTWKGDLEQVDDVCVIGIRL